MLGRDKVANGETDKELSINIPKGSTCEGVSEGVPAEKVRPSC